MACCVAQWLEVKPTDDEKTRNRKKKLQKSFKNKRRLPGDGRRLQEEAAELAGLQDRQGRQEEGAVYISPVVP